MTRRSVSSAVASLVISLCALGSAGGASAATTTRLVLSQPAAFSILGHSCGGIQEQVYATGFAPSGYPEGDAHLETRCGGSGRGGGYKTTTYSAWATVTWDWFGDTRNFARLVGAAEVNPTLSAEDAHGDRIYNSGMAAYLETTAPPLVAPDAPTGVSAVLSAVESGEQVVLRFQVSWTPASETAPLITSSTVTATPVESAAPVLTSTVSGSGAYALVGPLAHNTTYRLTVTNTDPEGTSQPSSPLEAYSGFAKPPPPTVEICEQNHGTIKLSPGLDATPRAQSITIKGELGGCEGPADVTGAMYVAHLKTNEEVTCSVLSSASTEPTTTPVSLTVKWSPKEAGISKGGLLMPISEAALTGLEGTIEGGPFAKPLGLFASSVSESFTGAPSCGVPPKKGKAKLVKSGSFSTTQVEIGK